MVKLYSGYVTAARAMKARGLTISNLLSHLFKQQNDKFKFLQQTVLPFY